MDGIDIISVSAPVAALAHLLKWSGVPARCAPLVVFGLSLVGVALWATTMGHLSHFDGFGLFAGWIAVASSASGVYGFRVVELDHHAGRYSR